jgi:hypothetical protein
VPGSAGQVAVDHDSSFTLSPRSMQLKVQQVRLIHYPGSSMSGPTGGILYNTRLYEITTSRSMLIILADTAADRDTA